MSTCERIAFESGSLREMQCLTLSCPLHETCMQCCLVCRFLSSAVRRLRCSVQEFCCANDSTVELLAELCKYFQDGRSRISVALLLLRVQIPFLVCFSVCDVIFNCTVAKNYGV